MSTIFLVLLVLLGKYQYVLGAVNDLRGGDLNAAVPIIFVGIGAVIGLVTFAQFLSWLFKQYHDLTVALLIGLMVGSLRKIWPWKMDLDWLRDALGNFVLDSEGHRLVIKQANVLPDFSSSAGLTEFAHFSASGLGSARGAGRGEEGRAAQRESQG